MAQVAQALVVVTLLLAATAMAQPAARQFGTNDAFSREVNRGGPQQPEPTHLILDKADAQSRIRSNLRVIQETRALAGKKMSPDATAMVKYLHGENAKLYKFIRKAKKNDTITVLADNETGFAIVRNPDAR